MVRLTKQSDYMPCVWTDVSLFVADQITLCRAIKDGLASQNHIKGYKLDRIKVHHAVDPFILVTHF